MIEKISALGQADAVFALAGLAIVLAAIGLVRRFVLRRPLDLFAMWSETRMVVYAAVTGALYFAVLAPFKWAILVPGFSEIRPGVALPICLSFLFGPAAAWGAGVGNFIGDFFGTLGPGSAPGFLGNFLLAYAPYAIVRAFVVRTPGEKIGARAAVVVGGGIIVGAFACATTVAWGVHVLGLVPFQVLAPVILINNGLVGLVLALPLTLLMLPRAEKWGVTYSEVLDPELARPAKTAKLGAILLAAGAIGGWALGMATAIAGDASASGLAIGLAVSPAILLMLVGILLL
jgi:energy-coupling factor transport system substrate-specific component